MYIAGCTTSERLTAVVQHFYFSLRVRSLTAVPCLDSITSAGRQNLDARVSVLLTQQESLALGR